jgi:hypothetical protein
MNEYDQDANTSEAEKKIREQVDNAESASLSIEEIIAGLAKLSPVEFAAVREETARRLGLTPEDLDKKVRKMAADQIIADLAKLSPLEYDTVRVAKAQALGVRQKILDASVEEKRHSAEAHQSAESSAALAPPPPEPWPEEVDGRALLDEIHEFIGRFVVVTPPVLVTLPVWVVFTYMLDIAEYSTRLAILSRPSAAANLC